MLNTSLTRLPLRFLLGVIAFCGSFALSAQNTELDKLNILIDSAWAYRSTPRPLDAESGPDDESLPDMSLDALDARLSFWNGILGSLNNLEPHDFSSSDKINYEVFRYIVEGEVNYYQFKRYLVPFNAEGGFHTGFARQRRTLRSLEDVHAYISRLEEFTSLTDQQIELMRKGLEAGYQMPCVIVEGFDQIARTYITDSPEESTFWQPVLNSESTLDDENFAILEMGAASAITEHVFPAYDRLADYLESEYIPGCRQTINTDHTVDGKDYYSERIRHFTTLEMTPRQVYDLGQAEVKRIRAEMEDIIEEVGFDGSFDEFLDYLRTDPRFYAKTPRELLSAASYHAKKIDGKLPEYFGKLPRLSYGVEPVPDEIAPRYTGGRYVPGNAEQGRSGTYWVNTYKLESRPLYILPSLTLHEAVPGHHLQISLAAEMDNMPEFRSNYYISAFGEGWALYTEYLGKEMGIYETPYEKFGALTYEMWRACRLVVDPGMHAFGWSRDQAVQFMTENTALSIHEINTEINRYIGWPGQAVSYKIGELKIRELRARAENALKDEFDLRAFHDVVLSNGSVPLFVLEEMIEEWIAAEKANSKSGKSD